MARLQATAAKLNALADDASAEIRCVEQALSESGVGVEVSIAVCIDGRPSVDQTLGYGKHESEWHILWSTPDGVHGVRPLLHTPRETRILSLPHLPRLVEAVRVEAERLLALVTERVE